MEMLRNLQPEKPLHHGRKRRRARPRQQKKKTRGLATKRFASGPISFPNNGSVSQFPATQIPIGSKRGDNYWPSWAKADLFRGDELLVVLGRRELGRNFADFLHQPIHCERLWQTTAHPSFFHQFLRACFIAASRNKDQRWNDYGRIHMVINLADEGKEHRSVNHRHGEIKNENAVTLFQRQLKAVLRIGRGIDLATKSASQRLTDQADERSVVINDKNPFLAHGRRLR